VYHSGSQEEKLKLKIKDIFPHLTKSQKIVAKYLLREYESCAFLTTNQLAEKINVSEATVTRFVNALKFNGYSDFQQVLQNIIKNKLTTVNRLKESTEQIQRDSNDIITQIFQTEMRNLSNTFRDLSKETLEEVINAIYNARKVFIIGLRTSHSLALLLYLSLRYIHKETQLVTPGMGDIPEQLVFFSDEDLVFSISFGRYAKQTVELLKYIQQQKKARIVVLTDSLVSPVAQYADYILTAHYESRFFLGSFIGPLSIINALVAAVSMKDEEKSLRALKRQEQVWKDLKVFFNLWHN